MLSRAILGYNAGAGPLAPYAPLNFSSDYDLSNYINFGQFPQGEIQPTAAKSAGIWLKRLDVIPPPASETLIGRFDRSAGIAGGGWVLFLTASGKLAFDLTNPPDYTFIRDITVPVVTADLDWHFAVVTKSTLSTELSLNLYWDGAPIAHAPSKSGPALPPSISYTGMDLCVGSTTDQVEKANLIHLCHSFVIGGELTPAEVAELYSLTKPVDLTTASFPGSIDHWCTLGDGCNVGAGACPDLSPLLNHGTALGGMTLPDLQIADVPP